MLVDALIICGLSKLVLNLPPIAEGESSNIASISFVFLGKITELVTWYVAFNKAKSPKSDDEDNIGCDPLNGFQVISFIEAEIFLGILISSSTWPSILINKSLSHQIVDWFTGAFLVSVIEGYPPTLTKLLPLDVLIVPKLKFPILINSPPKLVGISLKSSFVILDMDPEVKLYTKVLLPVGFCKEGKYLNPPAYTGFSPSRYFWSEYNWLSSNDMLASLLALKVYLIYKIYFRSYELIQ